MRILSNLKPYFHICLDCHNYSLVVVTLNESLKTKNGSSGFLIVNLLSWLSKMSMYMEKSVRLAQTHHAKSCLIGLKLNTEMHTEHTE